MNSFSGKVLEIRSTAGQQRQAVISCPEQFFPKPGQYLQAHAPSLSEAPLPTSLFASEFQSGEDKFIAASPIPALWHPGISLELTGPLGKGFSTPKEIKRLGLIAIGDSIERLLPLAHQALRTNIEVALFTDAPLPKLSPQIEANPSPEATNGFQWADFVAIDSPQIRVEQILTKIGYPAELPLPCPSQVLIDMPMPCGGIGDCGVCTVSGKQNKSLLVCKDGPVFYFSHKGFAIS